MCCIAFSDNAAEGDKWDFLLWDQKQPHSFPGWVGTVLLDQDPTLQMSHVWGSLGALFSAESGEFLWTAPTLIVSGGMATQHLLFRLLVFQLLMWNISNIYKIKISFTLLPLSLLPVFFEPNVRYYIVSLMYIPNTCL